MVDTASTLLSEWSFSLETVRCTAAGEYESVQCIEDKCLCVDPNTGGIQDNHFISQDTIKKGDLPCCNYNIYFLLNLRAALETASYTNVARYTNIDIKKKKL